MGSDDRPTEAGCLHDPDSDTDSQPAASDELPELTFVDEATFWSTF